MWHPILGLFLFIALLAWGDGQWAVAKDLLWWASGVQAQSLQSQTFGYEVNICWKTWDPCQQQIALLVDVASGQLSTEELISPSCIHNAATF